ncbi:MAG TPA: flagellar brake protein [Burkholderiales bacterium]|nr:flagellar brake protein [Burkholderiales bacterium]
MAEENKQALISDNDSGRYLVTSQLEIRTLLHSIAEKRQWVTAYFNHGADFLLTSIIRIHHQRKEVFLDYGGSNRTNLRITEAGRVIFVTAHDRVKIQFAADKVVAITDKSLPALSIPLPGALIKLQRREYYRVATPITRPLDGELFVSNGEAVELSIFDISAGGVCMCPKDGRKLSLNETFNQCRIHLPDEGTIETGLKIRHVMDSGVRNGNPDFRYGCMFVNIEPDMQIRIQRYILDVEREQLARKRI